MSIEDNELGSVQNGVSTKHILITGTGRAGTTLLVRILAKLGLETGFSDEQIQKAEKRIGRAGLEVNLTNTKSGDLPMVIKSPASSKILLSLLNNGRNEIDIALVPVRNLRQAANSRIAVSDKAKKKGLNPSKVPGGMWKTSLPENQSWILAEQFYSTIDMLVLNKVPIVFLHFPEFAEDEDYFFANFGMYLQNRFNFSEEEIRSAHRDECNVDLIGNHDINL